MEIVIESDPLYRPSSTSPGGGGGGGYLRSPVTAQPPLVSSNNAFYYATLPRGNRLAGPVQDTLDGAPTTTSVRRVDKSGLLEISDLEPAGTGRRLLTGAESHVGTLSRRRDRSGLLEAVPEVPDQCSHPRLASEELLAAAATARSMVERQQHLLGAETDIVESALFRRRSFATTDSSQDSTSTSMSMRENEAEPSNNNPATRSQPRVKFAPMDDSCNTILPASTNLDEIKESQPSRKSSVVDCLGRLSPRQRDKHAPMTLSNIPDVIETAATTTSGSGPEGERAEAEGCEHTAIESLEEGRVSYKGATTGSANSKTAHNDNIQAVHVIILSEQL